jgi:thiosulfate dehydrogenase
MISKRIVILMLGATIAAAGLAIRSALSYAQQTATHDVPAAQAGGTVVMLCDGKTSIEVKNLQPGQMMSRAQAQAVSDELMAKWKGEHPADRWEVAQSSPATDSPTATPGGEAFHGERALGNAPAAAPSLAVQQGDTYASFQPRDYKVWKAETEKFVAEGKRVFHDDKALGSTIGISCDMCHPDAANTHPETYPKYQVQLQRVALLRDMIDWCIENPIKGKALNPNDPKLRALEAYIYAQRKGERLDYGKH